MYDHVHLIVMIVGRKDDGLIFTRIETRINGAFDAIIVIKIFARHCGRIAAPLNVDEQGGLIGLLPIGGVVAIVGHILWYGYILFNKRHIDVHTTI